MKKFKLFLAALAAMVGLSANAQEDITSTYLTNADLSTVDNGWTYYSDAYKYQAWRIGDDSKSSAVEFYAGWGSLEHTNFKFSQTVTLPAGDYRIAVNAFYREGNDGNGTNANKAWIFAGETKQNVYALNGMSAVSAYDGGGDDMDDAQRAFKAGAFSNAFDFSLAEETEISLGFEGEFSAMRSWCILGPVKLYKYSLDDYLVDYDAKYAEAEALDGKPMNESVQSALTAAMVDRSTFSLSSEVTAAITVLTTAINNANTSIANYVAAKAYLDKASTLDEAGQASYSGNETVEAVQSAYDNSSLEALTDEQKTAMDAAIVAAVKAQTTPGSDWTLAIINPSFETGNIDGWANSGTENAGAQGNKAFDNTQGNFYAERWHAAGTIDLNQTVTDLPAGVYEIGAYLYTDTNDGILYANNAQTSFKTSNRYTVQVAVDADGSITLGARCTLTASTWICMDGFSLKMISAGLPDLTAVTGKMNAEIATAQTTAIEAYNSEKTVANYNAASAAVAAAEASVAAYAKTAAAIEAANALKEAHNFASAAATLTFAEAIAAVQTKYDNGTLTNDEANNGGALGMVVTVWHGGNNNPAAVYLRDGFSLGDIADDPALHVNTWSTEGDSDGSGFSIPFYESWLPNTDSLPESTLAGTLTNLPNGLYKVSAWVRVSAKNGTAATDATGITMAVNGGGEGDYAPVDVTGGTQVGESQFQLATYEAQGLVKDGTLTLNFNIAADNNISWLSFKNVKYTKVRDLTPEETFIAATAEDYAALNEAINNHVIGFEAGEYAPYNNVEAANALAAAKAIDQTALNSQEDVQAATAAINNATWTANATELNAVFDGSFEADYSGQSGNINPIGWQRVKGAAADGYNVRLMNGNYAGLAATSSGKALFTKQSAYYGYASGYAMPLKANTMYKITFVYGGWGDCKKDGYVSMADPDGTAVELSATDLPVDATNADSNVGSWKSYEAIFTTGKAGDNVLGLRKKNYDTSGQSQYVYGDIVIVKATADDIKDQLLTELNKANAIDVTANVGTSAFQIPAAAVTALTSEISEAQGVYDNNAATVQDVLDATANLKAAEEAFNNAELNAPADGQLFNIVNITSGFAHSGKALTFKSASNADLTGNTTSMAWEAAPGYYMPQAVKFTAVEGTPNGYKLSYTRADGNEVYISTGKLSGLGSDDNQIRPTTDASKALTFVVISVGDNHWYLKNTASGKNVGSSGDTGFYTAGGANKDMKIQEAVNNEVALNIKAENQYGTIILPFNAEFPAGVTAYSVSEVSGSTLTLVEVNAFNANTPYIVYAEEGVTAALAGLGSAYTDASYTNGLLTGVYTETSAPVGSYVLQKNNGKVGFYVVAEGKRPTVGANRAYVNRPADAVGVKAFYLGENDLPTAIQSVFDGLVEGEAYDLAGRKVQKLQKGGVYIINGKKVVVK